jgi:hypothetical protein
MEASHANIENDRIHREFDFRESQTEELIRQQQYSYDELMKIKIEKDVIEISTSILEKNIQKLFRQNSINERSVFVFSCFCRIFLTNIRYRSLVDLRNQVQRRKDEAGAMEMLLSNRRLLEKECESIEQKCQIVKDEVEKFRRLTLDTSSKLIRESFRISGKQRVNQNSEISLQLDDLSSHNDKVSKASSHDDLDVPFLWISDQEDARDVSSPNTPDSSLIWKLPLTEKPARKALRRKSSRAVVTTNCVVPSFSMIDAV